MASPIQPTPDLEGDDADRLLADLLNVCSPEEAQRRIEWAKRERARMMISPGQIEILRTIADGTSAERTIVHWDRAKHL